MHFRTYVGPYRSRNFGPSRPRPGRRHYGKITELLQNYEIENWILNTVYNRENWPLRPAAASPIEKPGFRRALVMPFWGGGR